MDGDKALSQPESDVGFIFMEGDQGAGLIVSDTGVKTLTFTYRGIAVSVALSIEQIQPEVQAVSLKIEPESPVRFRVEWYISESALNAAMTMNGGLLISPFSDVFPSGGLPVPGAGCGNADPLSTLRAGQFQSIDFKWEPGDTLTLYLVMEKS